MNSYMAFAAFFTVLALLMIVVAGTQVVGALLALLFVLAACLAVWSAIRLV